METAQPQQKKSKRMGVFSTIVGTVIGFFAGLYIGLHPQWLPVKEALPADDFSQPAKLAPGSMSMPAQPASAPAMPATQGQ